MYDTLSQYRLGDEPPDGIIVNHGGWAALSEGADLAELFKGADSVGRARVPAAPSIRQQAYRLVVEPSGVTVDSVGDLGVLYAIQTVRQLLFLGDGASVGSGEIVDAPQLALRGYMIDVSRDRVPTRKTLLRYLDLLLLTKMNHFELYTEHTFAYSQHAAVWEGWSPMTAGDIRWLDAESRARGIELVPNQNSFGHLQRWLSHDEYTHLAEAPDGFETPWGERRNYPFSLSPVVPETREFLASLYDELLPNFSCTLFNVGCDETFDLGQGRSAQASESRGIGSVYVEFIRDIHRMVTERRRRMLFYADIINNHPDVIDQVPKDAIAIEWWYEADNEFDLHCRRLRDEGIDYVVAPGTSSWNSITGRYDNASANVRAAIAAANDHGALGILMTDWGDYGHLQIFPIQLPPAILAAGLAWNANLPDEAPYDFLSVAPGGLGSGDLVDALRRLGAIHRRLGPTTHNCTLLGISLVLFDIAMHREHLIAHQFDADWVRAELLAARSLACSVTAPGGRDDVDMVRDEIVLAADLALVALDLVPLHRATEGDAERSQTSHLSRNSDSIDASGATDASETSDRSNLADFTRRVRSIERRHREQWIQRFRPGGLDDSVTFLWKAIDALSQNAP